MWVALFDCKQGRQSRMEALAQRDAYSEDASVAFGPQRLQSNLGHPALPLE